MKQKAQRSLESVLAVANLDRQLATGLPAPLVPLHRKLKVHADRLNRYYRDELVDGGIVRRRGRTGQGAAGNDLRRKRDLLREDYLIPMGRAGRKVLKFAPGAERAFQAPPKRSTAQEVVARARAMAKAARPRWRLFIDIGFPKDGAAKMIAAANELDKMASRGLWAREERTTRLRDLEKDLRAARAIIDVMDAIATTLGRSDPQFLFQWRRAKRIPKKLGRPKKSAKKAVPPGPDSP